MVKHLPTMRETWVRSLGREFPLEKEMATHSSTLTWKIPWTEEPDRLPPMELHRVGHDSATSLCHIQVQADGLPSVFGGGLRMVLRKRLGFHVNRRWEE